MVMRAGRWQLVGKGQAARHAEVDQQQALIEVEQQIFAAPTHLQHLAPLQRRRRYAQGPAQGLAHGGGLDAGAGDAVGKAQPGDFDFGQFRHGN